MPKRALIFVNGSLPDIEKVRPLLRRDDCVIAVDGGARLTAALGLAPDVVVGDMDSLPDALLADMEARRVALLRFPPHKDETDLELALQHARRSGFDRLLLVGALGGRLDQQLANLALLADPDLAALDVSCDDGVEQVLFIRTTAVIAGSPGDIVSLIPWGGIVHGVHTTGLLYPLSGEALLAERTRGISNRLTGPEAHISISAGLLLCVHRRE